MAAVSASFSALGTPVAGRRAAASRARVSRVIRAAGDCPCAEPIDGQGGRVATVNGKDVNAAALRGLSLLNHRGDRVPLAGSMSEGTAIVVFLRHLGWPFCWTYANAWADQIPTIREKGASLSFISVGDSEKLSKFLDLNPSVPRNLCYVDDSKTFDAYQAAGFGSIGENVPQSVDIKPPGFSIQQWFAYLTNVASLSPIRKDEPFSFPEGVLRLGGTFVLDGEDVVYAFADELPGKHPEVADVMKAASMVPAPTSAMA